jgi:hypothetical protein
MSGFDDDGPGPHAAARYVCGGFWLAGGLSVQGIARWDGASWSSVGGGVGLGIPYAAAVVDLDGAGAAPPRLLLGGDFSTAGEMAQPTSDRIGLAAWNGTAWGAIGGGGFGGGPYGNNVYAMSVFDEDGPGPNSPALFAGGDFVTAAGVTVNQIARWNGWNWTALGTGLGGASGKYAGVLKTLDEDGAGPMQPALYVGGGFDQAGGVNAPNLAKWNGSTWTGFGAGPGGPVYDVTVYDDDGPGPHPPGLYAAGRFSVGGGTDGILRWNGSAWLQVGGGVSGGSGIYPPVWALAVFDDDGPGPHLPGLYAGGDFTTAGGVSASRIAKWDGTAGPRSSGVDLPQVRAIGHRHAGGLRQDGADRRRPLRGRRFTIAEELRVHVRPMGRIRVEPRQQPGGPAPLLLGPRLRRHGPGAAGPLRGRRSGPGDLLLVRLELVPARRRRRRGRSSERQHRRVEGLRLRRGRRRTAAADSVRRRRLHERAGLRSSCLARLPTCSTPIRILRAGDGTIHACPCSNSGATGRGCANSANGAGALLTASGDAGVTGDSVALTSSGETGNVTSVFLQGSTAVTPVLYGDGLRCIGGSLKRLYVKTASAGVVRAPLPTDVHHHPLTRLGDPILPGHTASSTIRDSSATSARLPAHVQHLDGLGTPGGPMQGWIFEPRADGSDPRGLRSSTPQPRRTDGCVGQCCGRTKSDSRLARPASVAKEKISGTGHWSAVWWAARSAASATQRQMSRNLPPNARDLRCIRLASPWQPRTQLGRPARAARPPHEAVCPSTGDSSGGSLLVSSDPRS